MHPTHSTNSSKSPSSSMPSLPLEFLTTFSSLLISSHRNINRFYPRLLASSSFLSHPLFPLPLTSSQPQALLLTPNFLTCPQNPFISNLLNASILLLPVILLFRLYKRGVHEKFHDFVVPFAFCIVWGLFIFEGKEEMIKTDVVVFNMFPWLMFAGLLGSWERRGSSSSLPTHPRPPMFIFEGKEELVKTDVVKFNIFPRLVFLGLLMSWICK
ncbi:uncharacterized protein EAF01_010957 [Botrytis porri]|uniref:uncharacterized protein n=1 Tax=Botrytis porri TaxID=87229 RepID=UPI001900A423|nr:uncharacterized protein EAF01_010957 [Botrytis porri]KAF7889464.1 hypothetical protein EAF01_010957 [Botrytis porri]